jgi:hypothetical protein
MNVRFQFLSSLSRLACVFFALIVALSPADASAAERVRVLKSKPTADRRSLDVTVPADCGAVTVQRLQMRGGWSDLLTMDAAPGTMRDRLARSRQAAAAARHRRGRRQRAARKIPRRLLSGAEQLRAELPRGFQCAAQPGR